MERSGGDYMSTVYPIVQTHVFYGAVSLVSDGIVRRGASRVGRVG